MNKSRRDFMGKCGAGIFAACLGTAGTLLPGTARAASVKKPNFLFILVDDMGYSDLGCYGNTYHETPNIDRLAKEGMRFSDAYASAPVCSPTRGSIISGKYTPRTGVTDWIPGIVYENVPLQCPRTRKHLALEEVTLAEALKQGGYNTGFVGKWHLGGKGYLPEDQGFDINVAGGHNGHPKRGFFSPYGMHNLKDGPKGEYLTERLTTEAIDMMKKFSAKDKPFLMYLPFYTVHSPIQAPEEKVEKYRKKTPRGPWKNATYAAMVETLDDSVGRLLESLDEFGVADNTVVILFSDNGGWRGATKNPPLRGYKGQCYEGGIREPLIVRWPGKTRPGSECSVPVICTDFYPTMLEMAGLPPMPAQHRDGLSLVPLLKGGDTLDRDALYWHYPHYCKQHSGTPFSAIRSGDYKLIHFYDDDHVELYNLARDIGETTDLSNEEPERVAMLQKKLKHWLKEVDASIPVRKTGS